MPLNVRVRQFDSFPPGPADPMPVAAATVRWPSLLHALRGTDDRTKRRAAYCGRVVTVGFRDDRAELDGLYVGFVEAVAAGGLQVVGLTGPGRVGATCPTCEQLSEGGNG